MEIYGDFIRPWEESWSDVKKGQLRGWKNQLGWQREGRVPKFNERVAKGGFGLGKLNLNLVYSYIVICVHTTYTDKQEIVRKLTYLWWFHNCIYSNSKWKILLLGKKRALYFADFRAYIGKFPSWKEKVTSRAEPSWKFFSSARAHH